jgi:glyoxylase I family protein
MTFEIAGLCPLLQVFDMLESVRFYEKYLGFEVIAKSPLIEQPYVHFNWAQLKRGSIELMLNTAYEGADRPASREPARVAVHDDTILYFGCPDVDSAYRQLTDAGLALDPPKVAPYGMRQLYFRDPDGYAICLQWQA